MAGLTIVDRRVAQSMTQVLTFVEAGTLDGDEGALRVFNNIKALLPTFIHSEIESTLKAAPLSDPKTICVKIEGVVKKAFPSFQYVPCKMMTPPVKKERSEEKAPLSTAITTRFGQVRPPEIEVVCDKKFAEAATFVRREFWKGGGLTYPCEGQSDYQVYPEKGFALSACLLRENLRVLLGVSKGEFIDVDFGTGDGRHVLDAQKEGFVAYGTSASDLREDTRFPSDKFYHLFDSQRILEHPLFSKLRPHFMTGFNIFHSMRDPFHTISAFYSAAAPEAVLLFNDVTCYGIQPYLKEFVEHQNQKGYQIIASFTKTQNENAEFDFLLIQKTHPELDFPVVYNKDPLFAISDRGVVYGVIYDFDYTKIRVSRNPKRLEQVKATINPSSISYDIGEKMIVMPTDPNSPLVKLYKASIIKRERVKVMS